MVELYIEDRKIDLTDDIDISFNYETIDLGNPSLVKNSFSKTVNIPGTANNNQTFGHIFRFDKILDNSELGNIGNFYDPHKKVNWKILKNGTLINQGYCVMDNIRVSDAHTITYQMTLYGGIGSIFNFLKYNEDGSEKRLYNLKWNWITKNHLDDDDDELTPDEYDEDYDVVYTATAPIVAKSLTELTPFVTPDPISGATQVNKDIAFIPTYRGTYNDFSSDTMLVNTGSFTSGSTMGYYSTQMRGLLDSAFPSTITENGKTYTVLSENLTYPAKKQYGKVKFSRDLDPWEAGDIRVNEMNVGIRFAKLMDVIRDNLKDEGYNIEFDNEIKDSYHWNYGWIAIDSLGITQEAEKSYNLQYPQSYPSNEITWNNRDTSLSTTSNPAPITYFSESVTQGTYTYHQDIDIKIAFKNKDAYGLSYLVFGDFNRQTAHSGFIEPTTYYEYYFRNKFLVLTVVNGDGVNNIYADIYYKIDPWMQPISNAELNADHNRIVSYLNQTYGSSDGFTKENMRYHRFNAKAVSYNQTGDVYSFVISPQESQAIEFDLEFTNNISNLSISQRSLILCTPLFYGRDNSSPLPFPTKIYGIDPTPYNMSFSSGTYTERFPFSYIIYDTGWGQWVPANEYYGNADKFTYTISTMESESNGLFTKGYVGYALNRLTKKQIFSKTATPLDYLLGYCKMMNYRMIYDDITNTLYVKTLKSFYELDDSIGRSIIDINDKIDYSRGTDIKVIPTRYKTIEIGLEGVDDVYPVYLFNKTLERDTFNKYKLDTGVKFGHEKNELLSDLLYKNTIDWQQESIYYNIYKQSTKAYNTPTISWSLFRVDSDEQLEEKNMITAGTKMEPRNTLSNVDYLPKLSLFDKNDSHVDVENSFVFLNGFVKNYTYTNGDVGSHPYNNICPIIQFSDDLAIQNYLNDGKRCYVYDFTYDGQFYNWGCINDVNTYSEIHQATASPWVIPFFSRDLYNQYNPDTRDPLEPVNILLNTYIPVEGAPSTNMDYDIYVYEVDPMTYYLNNRYIVNSQWVTWAWLDENENFISRHTIPAGEKTYRNEPLNVPPEAIFLWVNVPHDYTDRMALYYVPDDSNWSPSITKLASWNIIDQRGLDGVYKLSDTVFISNQSFAYPKEAQNIATISDNEYKIPNIPQDVSSTERIYDRNWQAYLGDLYDLNSRDITLYVDLNGLGSANDILRGIYAYKAQYWVITKIENFNINPFNKDKFTKVTLHKIKDLSTWAYG